MRLFVAIELDAAAVAAVESLARDLSRRVDAVVPRPKTTWVKPAQVHLTVRFIGEVRAAAAPAIVEALAPPLAMPPFEIVLSGVGAFPPKGQPRVIWIGVADGASQVVDVERQVSARLDLVGVSREERPFRPHLTIGRVKDAGGLRSGWLSEVTAAPLARVGVTRVTLFESRLSSNGPEYTRLVESRLG